MSNQYPAISIITPAYNRVAYLKEAIQSALSQTFEDFELIVCDDSASVEIEKLCASFNDSRIIYRANPSRLGIAKNNFSGFQAARSDLCANLHDDDRWTPHFLKRLVPIMRSQPEICLCFSDHWIIDSDGNRLEAESDKFTSLFRRDTLKEGKVAQPNSLLEWNSIPLAMASVFRKSAVDWSNYPEQISGSYDLWLSYLLISSGRDIYYVPERLTEYRVHSGSGTAKGGLQNNLAALFVAETILANPRFQDIHPTVKRFASSCARQAADRYLKQGSIPQFFYFLFKAAYQRFF